MTRKISLSVFIFVLIATIIVTFLSAFAVVSLVFRADLIKAYLNGAGDDGLDYSELRTIDALFKRYSYYDLDDEELTEAVLRAYVYATGDIYAAYFTEEEFAKLNESSSGRMQGIGINIVYVEEKGCIEVTNVMENSPAKEAGIMAGDLIAYVGTGETKKLIADIGYDEAIASLVGVEGTYAEFTVLRGNDYSEQVEFRILRASFDKSTVVFRVSSTDASVGIVKITEFDTITPRQFTEAVDALKALGINRFVFDLRDNPGGNLYSISAIMSYFLSDGDTIISIKNKQGDEEIVKVEAAQGRGDSSVKAEEIGKYRGLECAVLVNENTASAAEVFTAVMRDYNLARIIGVKTFGKGSVQTQYSLAPYGLEGGIKLTTYLYFPPNGESYHGIGIVPDVAVELSEEAKNTKKYNMTEQIDNQLRAAIENLNK